MFEITPDKAIKDYELLKRKAKGCIDNGNFLDAYYLIETLARIAYHLNFRYTDDELEKYLEIISKAIIKRQSVIGVKDRFVFYDAFGMDNKGLTQQYIRALKDWGVDFLYVLDSPTEGSEGQGILNELKNTIGAEVFIVPNNLGYVEKTRLVSERISEYRPEKAFLHISPWDVCGISVWHSFVGITRYLIDLTDHAFWLGKGCSDFFIGFRGYGNQVSREFRGIKSNRLLCQTIYPILNNVPFQGFPELAKDKVVIFSGATYYKVYGENNVFLEILKKIVIDHPECIVLFAGSGDKRPFEKFLKDNQLQDRIILIGNRPDINEVFKHCDIYINTFPIIGGLMSQLAIANNKNLIGYTTNDIPCNFSEDIFVSKPKIKFSYFNLDEFHDELNLLIESEEYRSEKAKLFDGLLPSAEDFSKNLRGLIKENVPAKVENIEIDPVRFMGLYFSMENEYLRKYHIIKLKGLKLLYFKYDVTGALVSSLALLLNGVRNLAHRLSIALR